MSHTTDVTTRDLTKVRVLTAQLGLQGLIIIVVEFSCLSDDILQWKF